MKKNASQCCMISLNQWDYRESGEVKFVRSVLEVSRSVFVLIFYLDSIQHSR